MEKVAWIIGGGTGIGAALARQLAAQGWTLALSGRRPGPLEELSASHGMHAYPLDVTDFEAVKTTTARIVADLGRIDLMVFSAAAWEVTHQGHYDYTSFARIIDTNLIGAMRVIEPVLAQMRVQGSGEIALVASIAGYFGLPRSAAYSSGKAAMIALAQTMRAELAAENITVRLISPGFVKTDLTAKNDFPMPFLMDAEESGRRIAHGLLKSKKFEIAFPWQMVFLLKTIRLLPYPIFFWLMGKLLRP